MSEHKPHGKHKYGPEYMSREITVCGLVENPLCLTIDELRRMTVVDLGRLTMICGSGTPKNTLEGYRGVLLRDILDMSAPIISDHHAPNRLFIKATTVDGYLAVFSWQEIFNSPVGDRLLVLLEKDGQPLGESEGEFMLVSGGDYRPGPRRMRYFTRVEVCSAD